MRIARGISLFFFLHQTNLVALSDVIALLDALALTAAGVGVLEAHAVLVLALGEGGRLVCAVDSVGLGV